MIRPKLSLVLFWLVLGIGLIVPGCTPTPTPSYSVGPFAVTPPYVTRVPPTVTATRTPTSIITNTPQAARLTPSPTISLATLPPPLAAVSFPSQVIPYPSDWPDELHYPTPFILVEATSGVSLQGTKGWAVKLIYQGDPKTAADLLSAFFNSNGWQVIERTELDSKGFLVLLQKGSKQHSASIVIDPDTQRPGYTKIVSTVFL